MGITPFLPIATLTGGNITAAAGDVVLWRATSASAMAMIAYWKADGTALVKPALTWADMPNGTIIQTLRTGSSTRVDVGSTLIPLDNTIPQQSEGTEIFTRAITPYSATSKIRVTVKMQTSGNFPAVNVALFKDSGNDAIACGCMNANPSSQGGATVTFDYEETAGSTSARTFKVRAGAVNNAGGAGGVVNGMSSGVSSGATMGGVFSSSILVEEIKG